MLLPLVNTGGVRPVQRRRDLTLGALILGVVTLSAQRAARHGTESRHWPPSFCRSRRWPGERRAPPSSDSSRRSSAARLLFGLMALWCACAPLELGRRRRRSCWRFCWAGSGLYSLGAFIGSTSMSSTAIIAPQARSALSITWAVHDWFLSPTGFRPSAGARSVPWLFSRCRVRGPDRHLLLSLTRRSIGLIVQGPLARSSLQVPLRRPSGAASRRSFRFILFNPFLRENRANRTATADYLLIGHLRTQRSFWFGFGSQSRVIEACSLHKVQMRRSSRVVAYASC